jgi:hypothetical protein
MSTSSGTVRGIAWLALFLFVGGLLLPFVLIVALTFASMSVDSAAPVAMGFGVLSELLGFALGLVGWRHVPGKVAAIGAGLVVGLVSFATVSLLFRSSH